MGFSSSLQGKNSHEALLQRQDAELKLLENLKRWLVLRIKCDRDYASALVSLSSITSKFEKTEELSGSLLSLAVHTAIENSETIASLLKQNADFLSNITLEKLNALLNDKRNTRKFYQEEYNRLVAESTALQESVHRAKIEYEKSVDGYKASFTKYEELTSNPKSKGSSKKSEEVIKEKFQRAVKRLHIAHNDYVLNLLESADYERDFRTVLLPGLLEFQQVVQEDILHQCHTVIEEISQYSDFSSEPFKLLFNMLQARVDEINPESEFKEFIEKNKSAPIAAQPPIFDAKLSALQDNNHSNPLRPDRVAVDDLTLEALKQKLRLLEQRLSSVQNELALKQTALQKLEAELMALKKEGLSEKELSNIRRQIEGCRRQVGEFRCLEQKWQRQVDTIGEAVTALSGQVPSGCELHLSSESVSTSVSLDELNTPSLMTTGNNNTSLGKRRGQSLVDILKRPFSRKSMTPPASPGSRLKANQETREEPTMTKMDEATGTQFVPQEGGAAPEFEETTVLPLNTLATPVVENGQNLDIFPLPLPPTPNASPIANAKIAAGLSEKEWFHGVLPREEVVRLLVNDGDFLVRETMRHEERQVVLSVAWAGHKHFIVQTTAEGLYRFEGPAFPTVQELIAHQQECGLPVTTKSGAILKRSVPRETWELNNDDVELVEKIGSGNFGDVYRARLRHTGVLAAVKTCRHTLPDEQKKKFLQEGRILKQYEHPNVVRFIGICVQKQPIMIVMELVPGGSLLNYLRQKNVQLTTKQLMAMCVDVAAGMAYLESRNCIHRDLAVRNCLVGENNVVKISDFGMSREEQEYIVSDGMKQIPIKWTAPEALNYGKYTSLCDVWSFGVLSWEVFSRGGTPYSGLSNTRSRQMISAGYRMPAPEGTPDEMYRLMRRCWEYEPERRPHFEEICDLLDEMMKEMS